MARVQREKLPKSTDSPTARKVSKGHRPYTDWARQIVEKKSQVRCSDDCASPSSLSVLSAGAETPSFPLSASMSLGLDRFDRMTSSTSCDSSPAVSHSLGLTDGSSFRVRFLAAKRWIRFARIHSLERLARVRSLLRGRAPRKLRNPVLHSHPGVGMMTCVAFYSWLTDE
eukprot:g18706.t1